LSITYNETDSETYSKWIITIKKLEPIGVSSLHLIFNNSNGYFVKKMKSGLVRICRKDNIISGTIYPSTKNNDDLIFSRIKFYVKIQQN